MREFRGFFSGKNKVPHASACHSLDKGRIEKRVVIRLGRVEWWVGKRKVGEESGYVDGYERKI